jgi:N-acetylglucosamine kinase-like BadF-type ATPase
MNADTSRTFVPAAVIGVDAGGTGTRAALVATDGTVLGRGRSAGGNLRSSGGETAVRTALEHALAGCLAGNPLEQVIGGVVGVAGAGAAGLEQVRRQVSAAWAAVGLNGAPQIGDDIAIAFAAGTPRPSGLVLISGTGAAAATVRDCQVQRQVDGYGWIAGDEGSAVWLGLHAIRAALAARDGRGPDTVLVDAVDRWLPDDPGMPWAQRVIAAVHARLASTYGALAPHVASAAEHGDAVARRLVNEAAQRLWVALRAAAGDEPPEVVVLAGSVIGEETPVGGAVRAEIRRAWPHAAVRTASSGEVGAAALALAAARNGPIGPAVHARLTAAIT